MKVFLFKTCKSVINYLNSSYKLMITILYNFNKT